MHQFQLVEVNIMDTAIVYYSKHHGNTKKLLEAIGAVDPFQFSEMSANRKLQDYWCRNKK